MLKEFIIQWTDNAFGRFQSVFILIGFSMIGFVASLIFYQLLKLALIRLSGPHYKAINKRFRISLRVLITILFLNIGLSLTNFPDRIELILKRIFYILMIFSLAYILIKVINYIKDLLYYKYDVSIAGNLNERKARTQVDFLQKLGSVFVASIAIAIVLMSFERVRELGTSLLASAGIAGIIVGFAAQKSLSNLLAGFQIAFTQPIRFDDVVIVEGEWGKIEEITLTYVVVKLWDLRRLIVPISYFIDKPFQNWTRSSSDLLGSVMLYADYNLPIEPLRSEVAAILGNEGKLLWDGKVSAVQVTDANDKTKEIRVLVSSANASALFDLRCMIREKLIAFILLNYPDSFPANRILLTPETRKDAVFNMGSEPHQM